MERADVYKAIDSERDFQEEMTRNSLRPDIIIDFHVGDALSAIEYNLDKARDAWYKDAVPHTDALKYLRKIAALCVKMGEAYGMEPRN